MREGVDIDMHADFMRLRGKTYDYRIGYNQIQKLFLLPKPDDTHCQFVVSPRSHSLNRLGSRIDFGN